MASPLITTHGLRRVNFPACNADACHQGDKPCPCPDACQVAAEDDASKPSFLASRVVWIGGALSLAVWAAAICLL